MAEPLPFEEVYERHAAAVYRFCVSQVRNPATAEDLAADVFVAAFKAYERAHPDPDGVQAWLFAVTRNMAIDHYRRQKRRSILLALFGRSQSEGVDTERSVELRDELRRSIAAIDTLSTRDRQLIGLRVAADLSYGEIARVMGMSERAATVATHRALTKVRQFEEAHR